VSVPHALHKLNWAGRGLKVRYYVANPTSIIISICEEEDIGSAVDTHTYTSGICRASNARKWLWISCV